MVVTIVGCGGPPTGVQELTTAAFHRQVLTASYPSLVDFSLPDCAVCEEMRPVVAAVAKELAGEALVGHVDCWDQDALGLHYEIAVTPTFIVFVDGEPKRRLTGRQSQADLVAAIRQSR